MAATTHRGITYTGTGTYTTTVNLDLPLWAGVDQDDTNWLTAYPGALTSFSARQTDGTNQRNPRLVLLTLNNALAEGNTMTLSGEVTEIHSCIAQRADATANIAIVKTSALVLTFDIEATADGTTDDTSGAELWLIVS
jgi:hypothetical protein|tara:strand:- start:8690 stop:9103 length:414 start_codon:yes stop_codon:yes gene_type:complete